MMKKLLASIAVLSLTSTVYATTPNLTIDNHSDRYSTALVNDECLGASQIFTAPGKMGDTIPWYVVQALCGSTTGICSADVYVFPTPDCTDLNQGTKITTASLDLATGAITPPDATNENYSMSTEEKNYFISFSGSTATAE